MENEPKRRYRIVIRVPDFDYAGNATYFLTICTANRSMIFGVIVDGQMVLNDSGAIADEELRKSAEIRREIELHHLVVMPNHIHALLTFTPEVGRSTETRSSGRVRQPRSLGSFVAGYKSAVTKRVREVWEQPDARVWQPNYHEHIVRNERTFDQIWHYIEHNPARWIDDGENPESPKFRP